MNSNAHCLRSCKLLGLVVLSSVGLAAVSQAQTLPYNFDFEALPAASNAPLPASGNINTQGGAAYGWYSPDSATNAAMRVLVVDSISSPWGTGSKSASISRRWADGVTTQPTLRNYFSNRTVSGTNITGSAGGSLTGRGYNISWDYNSTKMANQPRFILSSSNDTSAIVFDITWNTQQLRYYDGSATGTIHTDYTFKNNVWYRFEVADVDVVAGTWDLNVYEWNSNSGNPVIALSDLKFQTAVANLDSFRTIAFSSDNTTSNAYLDNFSITQIPEPSTVGLLAACLIIPALLLRRRK